MDVTRRKITKIAREVSKFTVRTLKEDGIGPSEFDFIHAVRKNPGITQAGVQKILGIDKAFDAYKSILLDKFICINRYRYSYAKYLEKQLIEYDVLPFYAKTLAHVLSSKDLFATRAVQLCYVNDQEIAEERLKVIKRRIDILNGNDVAAIAKVMKEIDEESQ